MVESGIDVLRHCGSATLGALSLEVLQLLCLVHFPTGRKCVVVQDGGWVGALFVLVLRTLPAYELGVALALVGPSPTCLL